MKPAFFAKIIALAAIASVSNTAVAGEDEGQLVELLRKHLAQLEATVNAECPAVGAARQQAVAGLQRVSLSTGSLQSGSLQSSTGLGSGARGLTPADEWRRMFPRKGQP